jgi:tripartite-type tricarboxylate transporter receptor subunit TctC
MNTLYRWMVGFVLGLTAALAHAQDYPSRSVKIVVPYAAGATNDIIARLFAQKLSETLRQPFVVENRTGGAGVPGSDYVAKSLPDGYTLLLGNTSVLGIHPSLYAHLPYDPREFVAVSMLAVSPSVLVVNPQLPVGSVAELIALAKSEPGRLNYASPGNGTPMHLSAELFKAQTGTDIVHVPYKGAAPALADLMAGQIQMMFDNPPSVLPQIRAGKVRPLVSTGQSRLPTLPEVPTVAEVGFKGAESVSFFAIVVPKGTPEAVIGVLYQAVAKATALTEVRQRLLELGAEPVGSTPAETAAMISDQRSKWARVVKASGAHADD